VDVPGYPLPEYMIVATPFIGAATAIFAAWVTARYGRKVRLKIGNVEAEGRSVAEIDTLLQRAVDFQASESRRLRDEQDSEGG